jgi:hypothetical protein
VDHGELIDRTQAEELAESWPDPASWRELVRMASVEPASYKPISAALWEALWRADPRVTPERWATEGPQPPGIERLNPFLTEELFGQDDPVGRLARADIQAADLLEAALQAERVPQWWEVAGVLDRYLGLRMESTRFVAELISELHPTPISSEARRSGWEPSFALDDPSLPPNLLDDYEVALTRLLLIGHPDTTRKILPVLVQVRGTTTSSPVVEQIRVTEFAMSRLRFRQRVMAGARTAARVSRRTQLVSHRVPTAIDRELYVGRTREHPPSRLTSLAAVLVGTALGTQGTQPVRARAKSGPQS